MAATLPTDWLVWLERDGLRFAVVYELELTAGTLYYSDQNITWGGNDYKQLAIQSAPIIFDANPTEAPRTKVKFDHVSLELLSHAANDLLRERFMTIRLLLYDPSTGALDTNDYILLRGLMQRLKRVKGSTLEIEVLGPLHGSHAPLPGNRRFGRTCDAQFADLVNCIYTGPTTTTSNANAGPASTGPIVVGSGVNITNGDRILIADASDLDVIVTAGEGTTSLTVDTAITWAASKNVTLLNCDHEFAHCQKRGRTHEYLGFRGIEDVKSVTREIALMFENRKFGSALLAIAEALPEGQPLSDSDKNIPVIFGRRLVSGKKIEALGLRWTALPTVPIEVSLFAVSEGVISEVVDYYTAESGKGGEVITSNHKISGFFYRNGSIGLDASEIESDYDTDATKLRDQNRDFMSGPQDPLSRTAYVTFLAKVEEDSAAPLPEFDVKGLLCQKYDNLGAASGSPVWTRNPIWQIVNAIESNLYGLGRHLTNADIDFAVTEPEALVCDATIYGNYNTVVGTSDDATSATFDVWEIDDTAQYTRGMTVEVDESGVGQTDAEVLNVWSATRMRLDHAKQSPASTTIRPKIPRWTNDVHLETSARLSRVVGQMMKSFSGYFTYDDGKIQIRIERGTGGSPIATYKDTGAAQGYSIKNFEWLMDSASSRGTGGYANRVVVKFKTQENVEREAAVADYEHRKTHDSRSITLESLGIDNYNQAYRIARLEKDRHRTLAQGAEFLAGPSALQLQPGLDTIALTAGQANYIDKELRVVRAEIQGLGSQDELCVKVTAVDYNGVIYNDAPPPEILTDRTGSDDEPTITLSVDYEIEKIILKWTYGTGVIAPANATVWKSDATITTPSTDAAIIGRGDQIFTYNVPQAELDTILYFVVTAKIGDKQNKQRIQSNEVTAAPVAVDPTATQFQPGMNSIVDGNFDDDTRWTGTAPGTALTKPDTSVNTGTVPGNGSGTHTGTDNQAVLTDSAQAWTTSWLVGMVVTNTTKGETATITANDGTTVTGVLSGGADWDTGDAYTITGTYFSPGQAVDGNDATFADATIVTGDPFRFFGRAWYFSAGASAAVGRWTVLAESTTAGVGNNDGKLYYSVDAGATRVLFGSVTLDAAKADYLSPVIEAAAKTSLRMDAEQFYVTGSSTISMIYDIEWEEWSAPWALVVGSEGSVHSAGSTASLESDWHEGVPVILKSGQEWVIQIFAKAGTTPTDTLDVILEAAGADYTLLALPTADVATTWRRYAALWTVPSNLSGPFKIKIETDSTEPIFFDRIMFTPGHLIPDFGPHPSETVSPPPFHGGTVGKLTPTGGWPGTDYTDLIRIAEVT